MANHRPVGKRGGGVTGATCAWALPSLRAHVAVEPWTCVWAPYRHLGFAVPRRPVTAFHQAQGCPPPGIAPLCSPHPRKLAKWGVASVTREATHPTPDLDARPEAHTTHTVPSTGAAPPPARRKGPISGTLATQESCSMPAA